jgi:glycosyltransferase involved in cell wall biosynthesis
VAPDTLLPTPKRPDAAAPATARAPAGAANAAPTAARTARPAPRVSIVTPCHNGAAYLETSLTRLLDHLADRRQSIGDFEIIFVDDGSTDHGAALVKNAFPEIRVIRHPVNRGKGAAVRSGVLAAEGRFCFFIDADMPYQLDALEVMLDYLDRKEFHICIGTRSRGTTSTLEKRSRARKLASAAFTALVSRIVVTGIRDTQCGFKGFHSDVAKHLFAQSRTDNFAFDVEVLYLAFKNDLDVKKVPVKLEHDDDSSVSLLRHALPMLVSIIQLPFRYHWGRYALLEQAKEDGT